MPTARVRIATIEKARDLARLRRARRTFESMEKRRARVGWIGPERAESRKREAGRFSHITREPGKRLHGILGKQLGTAMQLNPPESGGRGAGAAKKRGGANGAAPSN
jgi:hypothetical protein